MYDLTTQSAPLRNSDSSRSNNAIGWERIQLTLEKLAQAPRTASHLVELKIYPNVVIARRCLKKLHDKKLINFVGLVGLKGDGSEEKLWFCGDIQNKDHEAEMSQIEAGIKADEIRRLQAVDPEYRADGEIVSGPNVILWEHERGTLNVKQIKEKMERYDNYKGGIIWTCTSERWIDKLARYATHDRHLFTTYQLAAENFHGLIWVDRNGKQYELPL